jgi:hypothetical protein
MNNSDSSSSDNFYAGFLKQICTVTTESHPHASYDDLSYLWICSQSLQYSPPPPHTHTHTNTSSTVSRNVQTAVMLLVECDGNPSSCSDLICREVYMQQQPVELGCSLQVVYFLQDCVSHILYYERREL